MNDDDIVYIKAHIVHDWYCDCPGGYFKIVRMHSAAPLVVSYPEEIYFRFRYRAGIKYMRKITEFERIMLSVGKV